MKIKMLTTIASISWVYKEGRIVDTASDPNIDEEQALKWLEQGIAEAVKEESLPETPEPKPKRRRKKQED